MSGKQKRGKAAKRRRARAMRIRVASLCALSLAFLLLCATSLGWFSSLTDIIKHEKSSIEDNGVIRVYLKSLGDKEALGLTLSGAYTVEDDAGFRFARDTELTVATDGKTLLLGCGGLTIDMGQSFKLTRYASDASHNENGLYIHESEKDALFMGDLALTVDEGFIRAIVSVPIEDYLYGVVAYEMSDSFPLEALKAQAVAARTYAIRAKWNAGQKLYDVVDTTADQVYKGFDARYTNVIKAVDATRGVVGMAGGSFAGCFYTASNGGQVATTYQIWGGNSGYDYIEMKDDPYDLENPSSQKKSVYLTAKPEQNSELSLLMKSQLSETLSAMGYSDDVSDIQIDQITGIEPIHPDIEGSYMYKEMRFTLSVSARKLVDTVIEYTPAPTEAPATELPSWNVTPTAAPETTQTAEVTPATLTTTIPLPGDMVKIEQPFTVDIPTYDGLEDLFSLSINKSDCETWAVERIEDENDEALGFTLITRRYGHGVGMSQRGAQTMAGSHNKTYDEILAFYYPGMKLYEIDWNEEPLAKIDSLPDSVGYARAKPTPKPTQAPLPALTGREYYARVTLATASSTLNVRENASTSARIVATLDHNNRVIVVENVEDGWCRIKTAELSGFVKGDYLTKE